MLRWRLWPRGLLKTATESKRSSFRLAAVSQHGFWRCCSRLGSAGRSEGQGRQENKTILKTLAVSFSLELVVGGLATLLLVKYFLLSGGEESLALQAEAQKLDDEWRQKAAELKAFYDAQPGKKKTQPEEGTELARFIFSCQRLHRMPMGLAHWKVQELEAIEGFQWTITRART